MDNRIIILMIALVVVASVGGYFVGLYQGAASNSLNLSNNSTGNVSNNNSSSTTSTYKATAVTVSTAKNKTVNNNGTVQKN
jgi:hypothetical protein